LDLCSCVYEGTPDTSLQTGIKSGSIEKQKNKTTMRHRQQLYETGSKQLASISRWPLNTSRQINYGILLDSKSHSELLSVPKDAKFYLEDLISEHITMEITMEG